MQTEPIQTTSAQPLVSYPDFWAAFEPAATELLQSIAKAVARLEATPYRATVTSEVNSDEYRVVLRFSHDAMVVADLQLILKDAALEDGDDGVGIAVDLYDHREQLQRIDGILQNFTPDVWKTNVLDLEDALARIDPVDMTNQVLHALRGQAVLAF